MPITVPAKTILNVRLTEAIDVDATKTGATFRALVDDPVMLDGKVVIPRSAAVVVQAVGVAAVRHHQRQRQDHAQGQLDSFGGLTYEVVTAYVEAKGAGEGKKSARKIGGGVGLGAIIGGIAGGGEGAAIGAVVGGVTGAVVASQGQEHLKLPAETRTPVPVECGDDRQAVEDRRLIAFERFGSTSVTRALIPGARESRRSHVNTTASSTSASAT